MVITQVHLVLETLKKHFKLCGFVTQHNATDGMLIAGMSTRAVAR
jgi:hypothetical protein